MILRHDFYLTKCCPNVCFGFLWRVPLVGRTNLDNHNQNLDQHQYIILIQKRTKVFLKFILLYCQFHLSFFIMRFCSIDVRQILIWFAPVHEYKFQPSLLTHASSRGKDLGYPRDPRNRATSDNCPQRQKQYLFNQISGTHPLSAGLGGVMGGSRWLPSAWCPWGDTQNLPSTLCPYLFGWCELWWDLKSGHIFMKEWNSWLI